MKVYIGTKIIQAKPMNLGDYNEFRGWTIPENEDPAREGYRVVCPNGYVSWSPKEVFEAAYREVTQQEKSIIDFDLHGPETAKTDIGTE